jgi:hypothetical protein
LTWNSGISNTGICNNTATLVGSEIDSQGLVTEAVLVHVTFGENQGKVEGGTFNNHGGANADMLNVTFFKNASGGIVSKDYGTITFRNTLLANNADANCTKSVIFLGNNLDSG